MASKAHSPADSPAPRRLGVKRPLPPDPEPTPVPEVDPRRQAALMHFAAGYRLLTGRAENDPLIEAAAYGTLDATPHLFAVLDWGHGDIHWYIAREWVNDISGAPRYHGSPRPKGYQGRQAAPEDQAS